MKNIRIILLSLLFSFFIFTTKAFSSNEFVIDAVETDLNNITKIKITYLLDTPQSYNFKVGVSCDNSDFRLGNILNFSTNRYINYSTGSWVDTPLISFFKNEQTELTNLVVDTTKCEKAYLKVRAKIPDSTKYLDTLYDKQIDIYKILATPTPSISPTLISSPVTSIIATHVVDETSMEVTLNETKKLTAEEKGNIFISEFMPYPSSGEEWVEIENKNDHDISLDKWFIDDVINKGGTPYLFSLKIKAKEYEVVEINKSLLNNSSDNVSLLDEDKIPIHKISYIKTVKGSSIQKNKNDNKWYITSDVTKGKENINIVITKDNIKSTSETTSNLIIITPTPSVAASMAITPIPSILGISTFYVTDIDNLNVKLKYYTIDTPKNRVYVVTEKDMPSAIDAIRKFIEKAFW